MGQPLSQLLIYQTAAHVGLEHLGSKDFPRSEFGEVGGEHDDLGPLPRRDLALLPFLMSIPSSRTTSVISLSARPKLARKTPTLLQRPCSCYLLIPWARTAYRFPSRWRRGNFSFAPSESSMATAPAARGGPRASRCKAVAYHRQVVLLAVGGSECRRCRSEYYGPRTHGADAGVRGHPGAVGYALCRSASND